MIRERCYLLLLVFVLSGCGMTAIQKQQVAQFGNATAALGSFAEVEFVQMRQEVVQMNAEVLILDNKQKDIPGSDFLDKPLRPEAALVRVNAVKALKSYGTLLNQLAVDDQTANIKKAAGDLVTNFDSALKTGLTTEQKDAATGLFVLGGNLLVEKMKKDAVKQIVVAYKSAVDELVDLLTNDFMPLPALGFLAGYEASAGQLENLAMGAYASPRYKSFEEREYAVQAYITAAKVKQNVKEIAQKAQAAIADLKKANAKLAEVMAQDNYTVEDIKTYASSVQQLINLVQVLALANK